MKTLAQILTSPRGRNLEAKGRVKWSGIPGSNRSPTPWQGVVLPNELIPQYIYQATLSDRNLSAA